jgi:hypothetical protein
MEFKDEVEIETCSEIFVLRLIGIVDSSCHFIKMVFKFTCLLLLDLARPLPFL